MRLESLPGRLDQHADLPFDLGSAGGKTRHHAGLMPPSQPVEGRHGLMAIDGHHGEIDGLPAEHAPAG